MGEHIITIILSIIGLWLGWNFIPKLIKRIKQKENVIEQQKKKSGGEVPKHINSDTSNLTNQYNDRGPRAYDESKGRQAPPDNVKPNRGYDEKP